MMKNEGEFLRQFVEHREGIWAFIRSLVRDCDACEDIFQQVAMVLWERFAQYETGTSFLAWARAIALNKIRHEWQERKRLVALTPEAVSAVAEAFTYVDGELQGGESDAVAALRRCVEKLPPADRGLVDRRYGEGLSLRELAEAARSTAAAINMKLSRIRQLLHGCMRRGLSREAGQ